MALETHSCDGPRHRTHPDLEIEHGPGDAVLTLLPFFFQIISNNPNTINFLNTFQILNEKKKKIYIYIYIYT